LHALRSDINKPPASTVGHSTTNISVRRQNIFKIIYLLIYIDQ